MPHGQALGATTARNNFLSTDRNLQQSLALGDRPSALTGRGERERPPGAAGVLLYAMSVIKKMAARKPADINSQDLKQIFPQTAGGSLHCKPSNNSLMWACKDWTMAASTTRSCNIIADSRSLLPQNFFAPFLGDL